MKRGRGNRFPSPSPQPLQTIQIETTCFTGVLGQLKRELKFSRGKVKALGEFDFPRVTKEGGTGLGLHWVSGEGFSCGLALSITFSQASSTIRLWGKSLYLIGNHPLFLSRQFLNQTGKLSRTLSHLRQLHPADLAEVGGVGGGAVAHQGLRLRMGVGHLFVDVSSSRHDRVSNLRTC